MNENCKRIPNFIFGEELIELNNKEANSNLNSDSLDIPRRWQSSAKAMAKFKEKGLTRDAFRLNDFMTRQIREQSRDMQDYEKLYKIWNNAVSSFEN